MKYISQVSNSVAKYGDWKLQVILDKFNVTDLYLARSYPK
jgi:hypothetical protein